MKKCITALIPFLFFTKILFSATDKPLFAPTLIYENEQYWLKDGDSRIYLAPSDFVLKKGEGFSAIYSDVLYGNLEKFYEQIFGAPENLKKNFVRYPKSNSSRPLFDSKFLKKMDKPIFSAYTLAIPQGTFLIEDEENWPFLSTTGVGDCVVIYMAVADNTKKPRRAFAHFSQDISKEALTSFFDKFFEKNHSASDVSVRLISSAVSPLLAGVYRMAKRRGIDDIQIDARRLHESQKLVYLMFDQNERYSVQKKKYEDEAQPFAYTWSIMIDPNHGIWLKKPMDAVIVQAYMSQLMAEVNWPHTLGGAYGKPYDFSYELPIDPMTRFMHNKEILNIFDTSHLKFVFRKLQEAKNNNGIDEGLVVDLSGYNSNSTENDSQALKELIEKYKDSLSIDDKKPTYVQTYETVNDKIKELKGLLAKFKSVQDDSSNQ